MSNRLVEATTLLDQASLDDLSNLTPRCRRALRSLCQHWADLAFSLESIELSDHHEQRQFSAHRSTKRESH